MKLERQTSARRGAVWCIAAMVAAALAGGCAASSGETSNTGSPAASTPVSTTTAPASSTGPSASTPTTEGSTPTMASDSIDPGLKPYSDLAIADLAKRLAVDPSTITVVSATLMEWPDASLGCPQPGMQYAQVQTDGSQIVLAAAGKQYRYHAGGSRPPFLCDPTLKQPPTSG